LSWADETAPPRALLSSEGGLTIEDVGLYAFNYRNGLVVERADGSPARDVALRRVRVRFTPFSVAGLAPGEMARRREELERAAVVELRANNAQITDCDFGFSSGIGFSMQGNDLVCTGNRVRDEPYGWCLVGGGRRALVEQNNFVGCSFFLTRGADVWFAHNRCADNYRGFREAFSTDGCGDGAGLLRILALDGSRMKVSAAASRTCSLEIPTAVRILDGAGAGQWREVRAFDGSNLTMDRPWDVPPDKTSVVSMSNAMRHHLIVENEAVDTGIAAQLYGGALDCVVAGNRSTRSGGFRVWGRQVGPGPAPGWYVQILDNVIDESYGTEGPEAGGGVSGIDVVGDWGCENYRGPTIRGILIRGNQLGEHATINIRRRVRDVLVEDNVTRGAGGGVIREMQDQQEGVWIGRRGKPDTAKKP
jgi:hypothetical protein